ncbi:CidA/LrgA family protein [Bordetella sp. FB-8]|uniref:CidA/LrgA family protein n=1 Tax=Bordetella sp. FB-8 TaxID=1159870 RepID=UPI001E57FFC7|nr:CidA/LrgA family protein [Bordetella sp. FB-8]
MESSPAGAIQESAMTYFRPIVLRNLLRHSKLLQIGLLILFSLAGQKITALLDLPVPGGVVGLLLVLGLLASGKLQVQAVRRGANWLLGEMLLFFVPSVMSLLNHHEFLGMLGFKVLATIVAGTAMVMVSTALTIDLGYRWMNQQAA